jgi:hypothetical protein
MDTEYVDAAVAVLVQACQGHIPQSEAPRAQPPYGRAGLRVTRAMRPDSRVTPVTNKS